MHGSVGLHSAMAIKRQRRAREEKRRARRASSAGLGASPATSQSSLRRAGASNTPSRRPPTDHRLASSVGMLHLGVVFLVLGVFLIGSGLLPDDLVSWRSGTWWNELIATGMCAFALGVFLILINRVMSRKEEEDLNEYVRSQLTRSRSGHRLERDTETGCLTTKQHRRQLQLRREDLERGLSDVDIMMSPPEELPAVHTATANGDAHNHLHLEKILEEESAIIAADEEFRRERERDAFNKETMSTTTTASLSPGSPSETRELLNNGRYMHTARI